MIVDFVAGLMGSDVSYATETSCKDLIKLCGIIQIISELLSLGFVFLGIVDMQICKFYDNDYIIFWIKILGFTFLLKDVVFNVVA